MRSAPAVCEKTQANFRDVGDHLARIDAAIDSISETTTITVNRSMARIAESFVGWRVRRARWRCGP
ncbi:MAG TPA: hypothetical protein VET87_06260 [Rubrivivax sp.]|nr:hypothetical protein [Rubrivivax sp.]